MNGPTHAQADAACDPENRVMDHVEREAGRPQRLEHWVTQMSDEETLFVSQTKNQ